MKSVVEYFQEMYGFTIQHTSFPCQQVGNQQRPNYLPMEVCFSNSNKIFWNRKCFVEVSYVSVYLCRILIGVTKQVYEIAVVASLSVSSACTINFYPFNYMSCVSTGIQTSLSLHQENMFISKDQMPTRFTFQVSVMISFYSLLH